MVPLVWGTPHVEKFTARDEEVELGEDRVSN